MIVLNGGSYYPESKSIDNEWISHINKKDVIGFIPSATTRSEEEYLYFFKNQMLNYGLTNIIAIDLYKNWDAAYESKVIFIAGGNTYKLLDIVIKSGFSEFLLNNHKEKIIVGNSAGAVILGQNIKSSNSDNIVGLRDTNGLGLVEFSICPHYSEDKSKKLIDLSRDLNQKVVGIPEHSAIIIDTSGARVINEIHVFEPSLLYEE